MPPNPLSRRWSLLVWSRSYSVAVDSAEGCYAEVLAGVPHQEFTRTFSIKCRRCLDNAKKMVEGYEIDGVTHGKGSKCAAPWSVTPSETSQGYIPVTKHLP